MVALGAMGHQVLPVRLDLLAVPDHLVLMDKLAQLALKGPLDLLEPMA